MCILKLTVLPIVSHVFNMCIYYDDTVLECIIKIMWGTLKRLIASDRFTLEGRSRDNVSNLTCQIHSRTVSKVPGSDYQALILRSIEQPWQASYTFTPAS